MRFLIYYLTYYRKINATKYSNEILIGEHAGSKEVYTIAFI